MIANPTGGDRQSALVVLLIGGLAMAVVGTGEAFCATLLPHAFAAERAGTVT